MDGAKNIKALDNYPGDKPSAYGIPLTYMNKTNECDSREIFIEICKREGINLQLGPICTPIHLRLAFKNIDQNPISCKVAESRCVNQEIMLFDTGLVDSLPMIHIHKTIDRLRFIGS
jgi:hypothetical protein